MAEESDFIARFEQQTKLLRKLKERVDQALDRAEKNFVRLKNGEPKEKIFGVPGVPLEK